MVDTNRSTYEQLAQKIREMPVEKSCDDYKWEELVQRLCVSKDGRLHDIGVRELEVLRQKCPDCPVFKNIS